MRMNARDKIHIFKRYPTAGRELTTHHFHITIITFYALVSVIAPDNSAVLVCGWRAALWPHQYETTSFDDLQR